MGRPSGPMLFFQVAAI
ncbi:DUF6053 domain-containing protein [Lysobacter enzymogenes]